MNKSIEIVAGLYVGAPAKLVKENIKFKWFFLTKSIKIKKLKQSLFNY